MRMKALRILGKTSKYLFAGILGIILFLFLLIATVKLFEHKITHIAIKELEKTLKAPISYGEVSILPFRDFPNLTVRIAEFKLGQPADSVKHLSIVNLPDTLISFKNVFISVRSYPLLKSKIQVEGFELNGFRINYVVDSTGVSNFDFLMPHDTTAAQPDTVTQRLLNILLKDLTLSDINLSYVDWKLNAHANINIPKLHLEGRVAGDSIWGKTKGKVVLSNARFQDYPLDKLNSATVAFSTSYDNGSVTIESVSLEADGIQLKATGNLTLSDSIWIDMGIAAPKINLTELSKFIPENISKEYGITRLGGNILLNATVRGFLYDTLMLPSLFLDFNLKDGILKSKQYPSIKRLDISGSLSVPNPNFLVTTTLNIKNLNLRTNQSRVNLSFTLKNPKKPVYNVHGDMYLVLGEFAGLVPSGTLSQLSGVVEANFYTKGKLPDYIGINSTDYFMVNTGFNINLENVTAGLDSVNWVKDLNASIVFTPNKEISVDNLSLQLPGYKLNLNKGLLRAALNGDISTPKKIDVRVDTLHLAVGGNSISARLKFRDLTHPVFRCDGRLLLNLDELRPFIPDTLISYITGKIDLKLSTSGSINPDSIKRDILPIIFENSLIAAQVTQLGFSLPNDTLIGVDKLSFGFAMANDTIRLSNLTGHYKNLDFRSDSTSIWNLYKTFVLGNKDKKLIVNTSLWADKVDYDLFLPFMAEDTTAPPDTAPSTIPQYIIRGIAKANQVKYGKVLISDFSTKFRLDDSLYVIDDMRMKAFGGSMTTSLIYDTRKFPLMVIEFKNESNRVNIKQMLEQNDDFEQNYITHKNIDGLATGTVFGRIVMQDTNLLYDKMHLLGNFKLENGGIYNFEPAMELAKFTNLNELDNIQFRTLETSVFIYNNQIYFPKTNIVSTAMDMSVYGMQSFGDDYEYHFVIYPGDLMLGKSKKLLKKQGLKEEGFEGKDKAKRSGLYLVALQRGKETKYGFDTKELQTLMRTTIRVQERGLNLVFHPHVMNFSTDIDRKEIKRRARDDKAASEKAQTN